MKIFTPTLIFISLSVLSVQSQNQEKFTSSNNLSFKENKGQVSDQNLKARPDVLFSGTDGMIQFHLKTNGISYQMTRVDTWKTQEDSRHLMHNLIERKVPEQTTVYRIDINWLNANSDPGIIKGDALPGFDNHYGETCPTGALNVKSYKDITYKNIYPGIDLKWYEKNGSLEYDYQVAAFADYKKIHLEYKGAEKITVNKEGELVIQTPLGTIKEHRPIVFQNSRALQAKWIVKDNIVSFDIKNVDPSMPLVIDPMVRLWGTYYGGPGSDVTYRVTSDLSGNVYMSGWTKSTTNIATSGAHQTVLPTIPSAYDALLVKFNSNGVRQWATYYGGMGDEFGHQLATDANGNVYMTGETSSTSPGVIATPGSHQPNYLAVTTNTMDAFLVAFNSSGVRQWGTYYGGEAYDGTYAISINALGDLFITGVTSSSTNISTPGSHQPAILSNYDAFLVKFNTAGVRQWATYFMDDTGGNACISDASGNVYIGGYTFSPALATPGAQQTTLGGGQNDGFFAKFSGSGTLQWATYYGGPGYEIVNTMGLDASGNLYGAGNTGAASALNVIATAGAHQTVYGGGTSDGFLAKFDPAGVRLWGTFYGGAGLDAAGDPIVDAAGDINISGLTSSVGGTSIATPCSYQPQHAGGQMDMFLVKFRATGQRIWGSYYGSVFTEGGVGSCLDPNGNIYICGTTLANSGTVMASASGHQPAFGGGPEDMVLAKFDGCVAGSAINLTPPSNLLICTGNTTTLIASCGNWYNTATSTNVLESGPTFTTGAITSDTTFYIEDFGCGSIVGVRTAVNVTVSPDPVINIVSSNTAACVAESITLTANGALTYSWQPVSSATSTLQMYILLNVTHTVFGTDANGCKSTATISVVPQLCTGIKEQNLAHTSIDVYPNPNHGSFTIHSGSELKLTLSNELGQTIRIVTLASENNFETTLKDLPNGVYFLIGEKENKILNQKIVVLH